MTVTDQTMPTNAARNEEVNARRRASAREASAAAVRAKIGFNNRTTNRRMKIVTEIATANIMTMRTGVSKCSLSSRSTQPGGGAINRMRTHASRAFPCEPPGRATQAHPPAISLLLHD